MGGFFLVLREGRKDAEGVADAARLQFRESGFGDPIRIDDPLYVLDCYARHEQDTHDLVRWANGDFIASVGTLIYKQRAGVEALHLLVQHPDRRDVIAECRGHFVVIERRNGQSSLLRDPLGVYEVYHDDDFSLITTSFLALARALPCRSARLSECVEYVINGVTFGTATPIREIRRLGLRADLALTPVPRVVARAPTLLPEQSRATLADQLQKCTAELEEFTRSFVAAFQENVRIGFSGGYDSRLLLALLRRQNVVPSLFVYGPKDSPDVLTARALAAKEHVPLEHVDKNSFRPLAPDTFPDMVRQNFAWNDGCSPFGIFSSDSENILRAIRSRPPAVVLNGGGGEVFRNYFKFIGPRLSVRNFVRCFFSHCDGRAFRGHDLRARFEAGLTRKISELLSLRGESLSRRQIECLYPHLRCHTWFARTNSIDNRFGSVILPYYDARVLDEALAVPLRWKHFGNFEGRMIRHLDPGLARYRSSHGFAFEGNAPIKAMLPDLLLYSLPPFVRRRNYRVKELLLGAPKKRLALTRDFLASVLDPDLPLMSRFFDVAYVRDNRQLNRVATLEYLFRELAVDVPREPSSRDPRTRQTE